MAGAYPAPNAMELTTLSQWFAGSWGVGVDGEADNVWRQFGQFELSQVGGDMGCYCHLVERHQGCW